MRGEREGGHERVEAEEDEEEEGEETVEEGVVGKEGDEGKSKAEGTVDSESERWGSVT